jgi:Rap1a immunity proteins
MRLQGWIAVAALTLTAASPVRAATEANFDARSTGDLVALCSAAPDNGVGTAAVNFCEGYFQGAVTVEMLNMAAYRGSKLFCLPNPPPTRAAAMGEFVAWARAEPDRLSGSPTDGLFRFLQERYPCPGAR